MASVAVSGLRMRTGLPAIRWLNNVLSSRRIFCWASYWGLRRWAASWLIQVGQDQVGEFVFQGAECGAIGFDRFQEFKVGGWARVVPLVLDSLSALRRCTCLPDEPVPGGAPLAMRRLARFVSMRVFGY
ncbi:hypothetical protein [Streptomyces sp. 5-10]|uniref:hypothetical protein n=1 Tax=Streptomyces sp. 5-10 TaxID=878925 RepID=UPI00168B3C27|nr:hypothetical protein [Streptomyces sp. 5-10]MBD3006610.1 hypothetical protein [Streptomyces sp. 5-10]